MNRQEILEGIRTGNSYYYFLQADEKLLNDFNFVQEALSIDGQLLEHIPAKLQDVEEHVLTAVNSRKHKIAFNTALQYASLRIRNKKSVVMFAVEDNGFALQYASEYLRDDYDIVMAAVSNYGQALQWASDRLRKDKDIVAAAITKDPDASKYQLKMFED